MPPDPEPAEAEGLALRLGPRTFAYAALGVAALAIATGVALRLTGGTGGSYGWFFLSRSEGGGDSWDPMGLAEAYARAHPGASVYDVFFRDHVKFQYPPSSLLLYRLLDGVGVPPTRSVMNGIVWVALFLTPLALYRLVRSYGARLGPDLPLGRWDLTIVALSFAALSLFSYPIMVTWHFGQIQAVLNLLFILACWAWVRERRAAAGLCAGLICAVKPTLLLLGLWGLLKAERRFVLGLAAILLPVTLLAVAVYGLDSHFAYVDVLSYISAHGESERGNQSVNGLLHRFLQHGFDPEWTGAASFSALGHSGFAPLDPVVRAGTVAAGIVMTALGLLRPVTARRATVLDLCFATLCFTIATPVAWEHHYGLLLPMAALLFLECGRRSNEVGGLVFRLLLVAIVVFSNRWGQADLLSETAANVVQSYLLAAALLMLGLTEAITRRAVATPELPPEPGPALGRTG